MDNFELPDVKEASGKKRSRALVWNVLTAVVLLILICFIVYFALIFVNPYRGINPFPPATLTPTKVLDTPTVTPRFTMVPTWTSTPLSSQVTPSPTTKQAPVTTTVPAVSPIPNTPTHTAPPASFAFKLQQGSPSAIAWETYHPGAGCDYTGVGGQVISLSNESVNGLMVQLGGSLPGIGTIDESSMTGYAPEYGSGGYEFILANQLVASDGTLWIQLTDQQKLPLSEKVFFNTFDDCLKNLIIISFNQVR